jgi:hypothetical protein
MNPFRSRLAVVLGILTSSVGDNALRAQSCDLAVAALSAVNVDSSNTVLVDHTVFGVPRFAFRAYSNLRRGDTALARVAGPQLGALNRDRRPIPYCLATERHWRTVPDSTLFALFRGRDGWEAFRARYGAGSRFALLSQPLIAGDTATLFVAVASGDLSGHGVILQFVRSPEGRWIKRAEVQLWIS